LQKLNQIPDNRFVFRLLDSRPAGSDALVYAVENTGPEKSAFLIPGFDFKFAASEFEYLLQLHEYRSQVLRAREWPKEAISLRPWLARYIHARKIIARRNL
jgi:hypothetical protein